MKSQELRPLIVKNPMLALRLYRIPKNDLWRITVYSPDSDKADLEKYHAFCKKLKLRKPPYLVVMNDKYAEEVHDITDKDGLYSSLSGTVNISEATFKAFNRDDIRYEHTIAHELGHMKDYQNRRIFLKESGGALAIVAAGFGGGYATRKATNSVGLTGDDDTLLDLAPLPAGIYAAWAAAKKMDAILSRDREFMAEQHATDILGKHNTLMALALGIEDMVKESIGHFPLIDIKIEFKKTIDEATRGKEPPSAEQIELAYAIYLAERFDRKIGLKEIWNNDLYPAIPEHVHRLTRS